MDANYVLDGMGLLVFLLAIVGVVLMWVMLDHPVSTALKDDLMLQVVNDDQRERRNARQDMGAAARQKKDWETQFGWMRDMPPIDSPTGNFLSLPEASQYLPPIPKQFTRYANSGMTTSASPGWSAFDIGSAAFKECMIASGPSVQYHGYLEASVEDTFQKCRYCGREWPGDSAAVNSGVCWDGWNGCGASLRQGDYDD